MATDIQPLIEADPLAGQQAPGVVSRLVRRFVVPALGPYFSHQREIQYGLLVRLLELEDKVHEFLDNHLDPREVDARFEAQDRASTEIIHALEQVRRQVDRGARIDAEVTGRADELFEVADAARALPFMEGDPLQEFEAPVAGRVIGYRGDGERAARWPYREFESVFRGSEERIADSQRPYLDLLAEHGQVLDVGCGRGELLDLLRERGIPATGVDLDAGMVTRSREKGHDVAEADAVAYLEGLEDGSLGTIFSAQLVEHLARPELERFVELAHAKLRPGGLFIAETVNPHCARALKAFWLDLTHQHPIFPEVALMLCRIAGFPEAYVFHPTGSGEAAYDRFTQDAYAVVATKAE
jgi:2-polyprenyl-3-methyl-5-hydroxy-6-metoxy-1,4-benzoquinol methylase